MLIELLSTTIKTCLIVLPILVALVLVKLVLLPLKRMRELKRPDASFYFFPLTGFNRYMRKDLQTKGDILYSVKNYKENHPGKKFQVTNMGSSVTILLRDSELIREFVNKPAMYEKIHVFRTMSLLTGNGLAFSEGDVWKAHRKIISSCFHYEFLTNNISNIMGIVNEFLDKIPPQGEKNFPVVSKMQEITGDVIGRLFFGEKLSSYTFKGKGLTLALAELGSQLGLRAVSLGVLLFGPKLLKVPFIPPYRKMMQDITDFRKLCFQIVHDRKTNPQKSNKDLLGTLLEAQQSGLHPEQCLSDEDIVDEFITFYFAGMDTTAHLVSMVFYNLTQHPEYLKVLKEERDKTYNTAKTNETFQKMDQLHAFLKETLRVSSPAPGVTFRVAKADHQLLDLDIKKGDILRTDFYALFMDEKNFKNATEFNPNRWSDPNLKLDSFAFTPFSAGPRNCIGQHLAILESKLIVSEFLERFDFKLKDGYNLKMTSRFLYEPVDPVVFELTPRK